MLPVRFMGPPPVAVLVKPSASAGSRVPKLVSLSIASAARTGGLCRRPCWLARLAAARRAWVQDTLLGLRRQRAVDVQLEALAAAGPRGQAQQVPLALGRSLRGQGGMAWGLVGGRVGDREARSAGETSRHP